MAPRRYYQPQFGLGRRFAIWLLGVLGSVVALALGVVVLAAVLASMPGSDQSTTDILRGWTDSWF
jgi:hypothetical protein